MFWLKVLFFFRLTRTFGPMIKIIVEMIKEMLVFCVIWLALLLFLNCIATLLFGDLARIFRFLWSFNHAF